MAERDLVITCPACQSRIPLTEQLAGPLIAQMRAQFEAQSADLAKSMDRRLQEDLQAAQGRLAAEAKAAQASELARLRAEAEAAAARQAEDVAALKARLEVQAEGLKAAREAEVRALEREQALAERAAALDMAVGQQVNEQATAMRERLAAQAQARVDEQVRQREAAHAQALAERDEKLRGMSEQIDTLKKRAQQGSMQVQGEAAEVLLESRLAQAFPLDEFSPVAKGARGADVVQTVRGPSGRPAGRIVWEVKQAQNWSPAWLGKLREDQRAAGAEAAVLVTAARPRDMDAFGMVEGVHVTPAAFALPLAAVIRQALIEIGDAKGAREGQATKMELVYAYLTGPQFRARIGAVVERFQEMQEDIALEKRQTLARWAKREKQIEAVIGATVGLHGDLQGIAGRAIPEIEGLEATPALPAPD